MGHTLREAVLKLFTDTEGYLSGECISDQLGCTRAAVWKQVTELRRLGYRIDAIPRKGYRLVTRPDVLVPDEIKCFNQSEEIGQTIRYVDVTPSTQTLAHGWAEEGAGHGALVVADEQTGGKGRLGRSWHSPPGSGIWMSLILKPTMPLMHTPHLTLLISVAVTRVLRQATGAAVEIKWPNDLLIGGRKVCGVLTEVRAEADQIHYCVAGIGINVHPLSHQLPQQLRSQTITLSEVTEQSLHRAELVAACCEEIEQLMQLYDEKGFSPVKTLWETYACMLDRWLTVHTATGMRTGQALGLDQSGALLLETDSGIETIFSADITLKG